MSKRIFIFVCGLVIGALLRAALLPQFAGVPVADTGSRSVTALQSRCAAHPLKMPCLFDASR